MTIKVFLMGGIGNQLFQINRALSLKLCGKSVVIIHLGIFRKFINFIIKHPSHKNWIDINILCNNLDLNIRQINFYDLIILSYSFFLKKFTKFNNFDIPLAVRLDNKKKYDIGYFQTKKHFNSISLNIIIENLIKILKLKKLNTSNNKTAALHVRGGDFMKEINNVIIKKKPNLILIQKNIKDLIKRRINYFIIANDKKVFKQFDIQVDKNKFFFEDEKSDFVRLTNCNLMFVSQSSYCFWAYVIAKKLNNCKILNLNDWVYQDLVIDIRFGYN